MGGLLKKLLISWILYQCCMLDLWECFLGTGLTNSMSSLMVDKEKESVSKSG